jgi:hypothetical protein
MQFRVNPMQVVAVVIALCLCKLAFFSPKDSTAGLIPQAYAGGIVEWKEALRIVTSSEDGATTYVWDYEGKTKVRKYSIKGNKLVLEVFDIDK